MYVKDLTPGQKFTNDHGTVMTVQRIDIDGGSAAVTYTTEGGISMRFVCRTLSTVRPV